MSSNITYSVFFPFFNVDFPVFSCSVFAVFIYLHLHIYIISVYIYLKYISQIKSYSLYLSYWAHLDHLHLT